MTNLQVAFCWRHGKSAASGHMSTDGQLLFSYALLIGRTLGTGASAVKVVKRYQAPKHYVSQTTSHHASLACDAADVVVDDWSDLGRGWV